MPWWLPHTYRAGDCLHHLQRRKKKRPILHSIPATSYVTGIIAWGWQSHILGSCGLQLPWLPITSFQRALTQTVCVLPQSGSCLSDKDKEKKPQKKKKNNPLSSICSVLIRYSRAGGKQKNKDNFSCGQCLWCFKCLSGTEWQSTPGFIRAVRPSRPPPVSNCRDGYFLLTVWVEGTSHCYFQKWNITGEYISEYDHLDPTKTGYAAFEAMLAVAIPLMLRQQHK